MDDRAARDALGHAVPAPRIILGHTAFKNRSVTASLLASHGQTEGIEQAEAVQVRADESRLGHVEVFRMVGVGASIF